MTMWQGALVLRIMLGPHQYLYSSNSRRSDNNTGERRNLQNGVGWDGAGQVWQGGEAIEGIYHGSCHGLPK